MTTPTTKQIGHLSEEAIPMEIDGFRGQLITAAHADYDTARAVWNGAIDRRMAISRSWSRAKRTAATTSAEEVLARSYL